MRNIFLATLVWSWCCWGTNSKSEQPDLASVEQTLHSQVDGSFVDRRISLSEFLATTTSTEVNEFARWHAGFIKHDENGNGGDWREIESLSPADSPTAYGKMRDQLQSTVHGQLKLARWCAQEGLDSRAKAHFIAVIQQDPNNLVARQALGHVAVGSGWIARELLDEQQERMRRNFSSLSKWTPELERILESASSRSVDKASDALRRIEAIDTEDALPALEFFASNIDDDLAQPLIRKIASCKSRDACQSLVRIALAHPSDSVRSRAAGEIKKYPQHFFVPYLLDMLAEEMEVDTAMVVRPDGNVVLETVFKNELQDAKNIRHFTKAVNVIAKFASRRLVSSDIVTRSEQSVWSIRYEIPKDKPLYLGVSHRRERLGSGRSSASSVYVPQRVLQGAAQTVAEQSKQQTRAVEQVNRELKAWVQSVCNLLRSTTGEKFENDPELWWTWWIESNERYASGKQTDYRYSQEKQNIEVSSIRFQSNYRNYFQDLGKQVFQYSCLVPGTLIQTETGLVAIEDIQVGDMVVSQNVETAELALKPVLMTTVRPPKSTVKIVTTDNEVIDATGGHNWWVTGQGWVQTSKLQPGMRLHTATSTAEVKELIESPEKRETHNLVVDEFHTYFVGPSRILSYDNSTLQPSLRQIPGYGQQVLVANN